MRAINYIVIHTTAGPQTQTVASILSYWRNSLNWKSVGYHRIIQADGTIVKLAEDSAVTNGVAGYNANSLHVSYIGGVTANGTAIDNRTPAQKRALASVVLEWKLKHPNAIVQGHRDFPRVAKSCPCFEAKTWWSSIEREILK